MSEIKMSGFDGTNPLGVLGALGTFRSAAIRWPDVRLRWDCNEIVPVPSLVFSGSIDLDHLIETIDDQRPLWQKSKLLSTSHGDVKDIDLAAWATSIADERRTQSLPTDELFVALVSQGAKDLKGNNKPSHLHFTAGQQQFLDIVRDVCAASNADRLYEAIAGPWRFDSHAKTLRWDSRVERVYALRGFNPSKEPSFNIPGADWLGFLGLSYFPTSNRYGQLVTTACNRDWKISAFRWPLWEQGLSHYEVRQLVRSELLDEREQVRLHRSRLSSVGVHSILEAPIRRSDQGGYGSFGAASVKIQANSR